jgi:solute carrier family 44 (choline transporter-like protein), member 1
MTKITKELLGNIAESDAGRYMGDLARAWWVLLVVGFISTALAFGYLVMLKHFAKPIIFFSFISILILLIGGGFYVYFMAGRYEEGDSTQSVMKGMGILIWILAGVYFVLLACCYKRIQLGISIVEAAADFVGSTPRVFLIPAFFFFFTAVWVVWWVISAVWVFSVGEVEYGNGVLASVKWNTTTRYVWIYHLFGLFWISAFLIGCAQFMIASVCCLWYF